METFCLKFYENNKKDKWVSLEEHYIDDEKTYRLDWFVNQNDTSIDLTFISHKPTALKEYKEIKNRINN